jgi:hypothetical protein
MPKDFALDYRIAVEVMGLPPNTLPKDTKDYSSDTDHTAQLVEQMEKLGFAIKGPTLDHKKGLHTVTFYDAHGHIGQADAAAWPEAACWAALKALELT